jgi:hypothetical protein
VLRIISLLLALVLATGRPLVPGIITSSVGPCSVGWHVSRALVLAGPGRDMPRLWPLPPASPWWVDQPKPELPGHVAAFSRVCLGRAHQAPEKRPDSNGPLWIAG